MELQEMEEKAQILDGLVHAYQREEYFQPTAAAICVSAAFLGRILFSIVEELRGLREEQ